MSIRINDLTVRFKNGVVAVNKASLEIPKGIYGLLGENGAGKTTLMRVLTTVLKQTEGMVFLDGILYNEGNYEKIQKKIGYLPQEIDLYPNLTVKEYNLISTSKVRNEMIIDDVITCVARKQTPVILTRFKEHAKFLYDALKEKADHVFLLYGDNSDKENAEIRVKLKQIPENESLILVATGQKIGEGFDFPRLDVLMLAAPVSFEGRLEQYVGRLNRDYVGKQAVYVYDYIDSHVRYFDKMYAKRLRTYRKMGFSIWTQELQPKQIINAIFGSVNYTEKFEQDIVESEKMVVISSPDIRQDKIDRFLLLIKKRQEVGVKVTVITTDPEDITYGKSDVCYELIRAMQLVGINVITRTEVEECFAVIDDEIVWHGGMNLLGKADVWDNLMRIRNSQVATELLEIALGCSEEGRKSE